MRSRLRSIGDTASDEGSHIDETFRKIGRSVAGAFILTATANFARQIATVRGEFQQLEVAFKAMLGSAEKADALMSQLVKTVAITPFDLQGGDKRREAAVAYGLASDKVNETLIQLGDIAAGLSIPLNDIVYLYSATMTHGRLYAQDLNQFMGRGIPLADELARQFGVAKNRVKDLVSAGRVGFPEVQKAIEAMTGEGGSVRRGLHRMCQVKSQGHRHRVECGVLRHYCGKIANFKLPGNKEAEYLAHAFENAFLGNRIFQKYLPDIYNEMIAYIKALKPS